MFGSLHKIKSALNPVTKLQYPYDIGYFNQAVIAYQTTNQYTILFEQTFESIANQTSIILVVTFSNFVYYRF